MLLGYMRVSRLMVRKCSTCNAMRLSRQAWSSDIYEDKASGSKDDRPGLAACLKALRKDDVLVVWRLDRLGRNLPHLIETVEDLTKRARASNA